MKACETDQKAQVIFMQVANRLNKLTSRMAPPWRVSKAFPLSLHALKEIWNDVVRVGVSPGKTALTTSASLDFKRTTFGLVALSLPCESY